MRNMWKKRHCVYAPTLQELREKEKSVIIDDVNGIKAFDNTTLAEMSARACQLCEHRKQATAKNMVFLNKFTCKYPMQAILRRR